MTLHWHTEPFLLLGLIIPTWIYSLWIGPLSPEEMRSGWARPLNFYLGIIIVYLAVGSPIDQIGESYLFSVHMFQHLLLMYVAPIFLVIGIPPAHLDHFLERRKWLVNTLRPILNPVTAAVLFTLIFSLWHVPTLYEAALTVKWIHILQHITITVPSIMVCWCLFSSSRLLPPLSYPGRLLLLFILTITQLPVFGILTMMGEVLYPTYEWAPRIVNISPLDDQILGGLIMKIGGMFFVFPIFGYCFYQWAKTENPDPYAEAKTNGNLEVGSRNVA